VVTERAERRTAVLGPGPSTFVGREQELAALTGLLGSARLVTLVGPGGSGKSRLALEAADGMASADREVVVVELAALRDPALVPAAIAGALGLRASGSEAPFERLVRFLESDGADRLLLLDNLEQLLPAAAETVAELLGRCPGLRLLVTSRVPLNLRAEQVFRVEPLPVPGAEVEPGALADVPSVALFAERARAVQPGFRLEESNGSTVAALCRNLDGLPLALELAAARLRLLSPTALLARLEQGLGVLAGGPVDAEERHRTLRDTIAWSVALQPPREAALFGRLGVFRGGFDLSAVQAVAEPGIVDSEDELLERLGVLVDQSLVRVADGAAQPRFGMLETIREYAREHLEDERTLRDAHLVYYLALAEDADRELNGPGHATAARRIGADIENLRAALSWAETSGRHAELLRLAAALALYWRLHGDIREGRDRLERAIALAPSGDPALARALLGLARIAETLRDPGYGRHDRAALEAAQASGDERTAGRALLGIAYEHADTDRLDEATAVLERVLEIGHSVPDATLVCDALVLSGSIARERADFQRARACCEEAGTVAVKAGYATSRGVQLNNLAMLVRQMGEPRRALSLLTDAVEVHAAVGDHDGQGWAMLGQAFALTDLFRVAEARTAIHEGLALGSSTGSPDHRLHALSAIALWLGVASQPREALQAWAAHERGRSEIGFPYGDGDRSRLGPLVARDRRAAGEPRASLAWAEGEAMDLEAALTAALRAMDAVDLAHRPSRPLDPRGRVLTRREVEVLALVGEGCSDGQIAERLFISKKTASVHVANIKDKLGTGNRVETALAAVRMGLVPATASD
jgi:predicted ATPase/DNA-binding CsgD family transcriptional regulator